MPLQVGLALHVEKSSARASKAARPSGDGSIPFSRMHLAKIRLRRVDEGDRIARATQDPLMFVSAEGAVRAQAEKHSVGRHVGNLARARVIAREWCMLGQTPPASQAMPRDTW